MDEDYRDHGNESPHRSIHWRHRPPRRAHDNTLSARVTRSVSGNPIEEHVTMRPILWTLRGILCLLLCLGGAATAQPPASAQPDGSIAAPYDDATDLAINERLRTILNELDGYDNVVVTVRAGVVTLTGETRDHSSMARLAQIVTRIDGVAAINNRLTTATGLKDRLLPSVDRFVTRAAQTLAFLPLFAVAFAALLAIYLLGRLAAALPIWARAAPNTFIGGIYRQAVRMVFLLTGLVVALDILDATALLGSILGAAGIIGLAIGFAVRDTVENFIASVMLSIRQPFRPFDLVEIEGDVGKVIRLTSRATILLSLDGNAIRVPNSTVFKSRIVNFSRNPERRFTFAIDIDPAADMASLRDHAQAKLAGLPFVLDDPACVVWIDEKDGCEVELRFAAWIDQTTTSFERARGEAFRILRAMVQEEGALPPPPVTGVYTIENPPPGMRRDPVATNDLAIASIADLTTTDSGALDRMAQAERDQADSKDLLGSSKPQE